MCILGFNRPEWTTMDLAAMMGYSGAIYKNFFGSVGGTFAAALILALWVAVPVLFAFRVFRQKDL